MRADDDRRTPVERNAEHMARIRAVHRRSAYERVSRRISYFEQLEAEATAGLRPPLRAVQVEALHDLRELRTSLWRELVLSGQEAG